MSNNKRGNFFKFKNVQVVCRPNSGRQTRQNTQITSQGTTENQFADIAAAAYAEALRDINDILTDDESVHYSPPHQQLIELQIQVQIPHQQPSDSDDTNIVTPENGTDSSLDTSSIEVIQPHEGLEIQLPINPPQCTLQNSPQSPRINVAVPIQDGLITDDEETGDQVVPPAIGTRPVEKQGR